MSSRRPSNFVLFLQWFAYLIREGWGRFAKFVVHTSHYGWVQALALAVLVLVAYIPALGAGFIWADDVNITSNPLLTAPDALRQIWFSFHSASGYFPLTHTTFYLEHFLWQNNPGGYHFANVMLHAGNTILLWQILRRLNLPGAWLAAALFALHPIHVESVAWISGRDNLLMGFFFLLAVLMWVRFTDPENERPWPFYGLALLFCLLALAAKAAACALPVVLLLILWLRNIRIDSKRWGQLAPFFAFSILFGLIAFAAEQHNLKAQDAITQNGFIERVLIAGRALWFYLFKLVWPFHLSANYPRWTSSPGDILGYAAWLGVAALAAAIWWAQRWTGRAVAVGAVFFLVTVAPTLGLLHESNPRYPQVADHFQYLASAGWLALAGAGIWLALDRIRFGRGFLQLTIWVVGFAGLGALAWQNSGNYADAETFWQAVLRENPHSLFAHRGLGHIAYANDQMEVAIGQFKEALASDPKSPQAYNDVALTLLKMARADEAVGYDRQALALRPDDPVLHCNLARALDRKGAFDEAATEYKRALELRPDMAAAVGGLGVTLMKSGKIAGAIGLLEKAVATDPKIPRGELFLGIAYANNGQPGEAVNHFRKAVEIDPNEPEAHSNLGMALAQSGQAREAIQEFETILNGNPDQMEACNNLAWLLATASDKSFRDGARAITLAEHARQLGGEDNPVILHTLASAYAETGNYPDAVKTAQQALDICVRQTNNVLAGTLRSELRAYRTNRPNSEGITPRSLELQIPQ